MAGKYEHLIKPLSIGLRNWEEKKNGQSQAGASVVGPGNAKKEIWLNGRDHLEELHFNLSWGVHNSVGDWHANGKPHTHSQPECLFFVGLDTANVNYLGAEVECCLGSEKETYTFNEPTVVLAPAGFPHGPISTKRLFSPKGFGFFAAGLSAAPDLAWWEEKTASAEPVQATGKYAHLVKSLKPGVVMERGKFKFNPSRFTLEKWESAIDRLQTLKSSGRIAALWEAKGEEMEKKSGLGPGPGHPDHLTWMYGNDLGGMNANIAWGFCSQPGIWQRGVAHFHPADELMIFLGTDPNSDDLGAEIEIDLGEEHERHLFDKSSAVICPAGLPHAPIVTRWVDRPFAFLLFNLAADLTLSSEECLRYQPGKNGSDFVQEEN